MEFDFGQLTVHQRYKLMTALIVPRPIALITTINPNGSVNAAPFSLFNMAGEDPPIVMVSMNRRDDDTVKDTALNIVRTEQFVVHVCDEAMAVQMHRCSDRLPHDASELPHAGLTEARSMTVAPPRIAEAPVAFECTLFERVETKSRQIFIGEVRWLHVREGLVDTDAWRVRLQDFHPIGRFGANLYTDTRNRFEIV